MDAKLCSLQLDGLVDFSEAAAKFIVLGSTNKHYTVTLSDARHTCQCVDFRCPYILCSPPSSACRGRYLAPPLVPSRTCDIVSQPVARSAAR